MLFHTNHGFAASVAQATRRGRMRTSPARPPTKFTPNCVLDLRNVRPEERRFGHYLLVRRSLDERREHTHYVVYTPRRKATPQTLVSVAGRRWEIEIGFEAAKGECGLDQYEVRRWQGWYRHITLALLAHAMLAVLRVRSKKKPDGVVPLSL